MFKSFGNWNLVIGYYLGFVIWDLDILVTHLDE
jgi:hypothetical protein